MELQQSIYEELISLRNKFDKEINRLNQKVERIPPIQKELLTYEDAEAFLSCKRQTVERLMKAGIFNGYRLRKRIYFKRSEIILALAKMEDFKEAA